jgi:uncharacterized protein YbjT (DUF2867 family)
MKIVIIGGTGKVGSALARLLRERGHEAVPAAPSTGVDAVTGAGLADVLRGARVVVDVTNSPSFEDGPALEFFTSSTRNLLAAEKDAGVGHHIALSIVGADRIPDSGYLRAKVAQEGLIRAGEVPYTILRATQFFEFLGMIADAGTQGDSVAVPPCAFQPVAAADVSAALADIAVDDPVDGIVEVAGPDRRTMADFIRRFLTARNDPRGVAEDPGVRYYGGTVEDELVPAGAVAHPGATGIDAWLASPAATR